MTSHVRRFAIALLLVTSLASVSACRPAKRNAVAGGHADRGRQDLRGFGCGSCHTIGGVTGAHGQIGPPLTGVASRAIIAGQLPNTPDNMMRWIRNPQSVNPNTAMPNLHVDEQTARDMVAYLYTLR